MSSLKDKAIKFLGGFTKDEMEFFRIRSLLREPCFGRERLDTVKLRSSWWTWEHERIPEDHLICILVEGLTEEIKEHIRLEVSTNDGKRIYEGELEVVVREGEEI